MIDLLPQNEKELTRNNVFKKHSTQKCFPQENWI